MITVKCSDGALVQVPVPQDNDFLCGLADCAGSDSVPFDAFGSGAVRNLVRLLDGLEVDPSLCELSELEELGRFVGVRAALSTGVARQRYALYQNAPDLYEITMEECEQRRAIASAGLAHAPFSTLVDLTEALWQRDASPPKRQDFLRLFDEELFKRDACSKAVHSPRIERRSISKDAFVRALIFRVLCLGNVVVAGGCALDMIGIASGSDVDLFVWGLPTSKAATEHVKRIVRELGRDHIDSIYVTDNAVTIHLYERRQEAWRGIPKWTFQIILRLYGTPDEVLHGFDIQACKACAAVVDGQPRYYGTQSFVKSAMDGIVWADPERQSMSYAARLSKYWAKGFDVLLPGVEDRRRIDPEVYACNPQRLHGMALQLRIEREVRAAFYEKANSKKYVDRQQYLAAALNRLKTTGCYKHDYMKNSRGRGSSMTYLYGLMLTLWRDALRAVRIARDNEEQLNDLKWTVRDPGSQTVIGSFYPEQYDFYDGMFNDDASRFQTSTGSESN